MKTPRRNFIKQITLTGAGFLISKVVYGNQNHESIIENSDFIRVEPLSQAEREKNDRLKSLYDEHRWFQLRDEIAKTNAPIFYKAAIEAAFNQCFKAEKDLLVIIDTEKNVQINYQSRELLIGLYFRQGRYNEAFNQAQNMIAQHPNAADIKNILPTLQVLSKFKNQSIVWEKITQLNIDIEDGNLILPVTINGIKGNYIFDNGFSMSGMSESEAARLKLTVHDAKMNIDTMNGQEVGVRIAVVNDLQLGETQLKNVAFYVVPDSQPPFNELRDGHKGILGLPVALALKRFNWKPRDLIFSILPASTTVLPSQEANLAIDGTSILNSVKFEGKSIDFSLDMGAQKTELYPSFAKKFPQVTANGVPEVHKITGVGGSAEIASIVLPALTFKVGGQDLALKPAHILLKENNSTSGRFVGNLGMDILNQSKTAEVDFSAMTLVVD